MTIIRPPAPKYGINEIVYFKESAMMGHIEPQIIKYAAYDPGTNKMWYSFVFRKSQPTTQTVGDAIDLKSSVVIRIPEEDLITFKEALEIKRNYLVSELQKVEARLSELTV